MSETRDAALRQIVMDMHRLCVLESKMIPRNMEHIYSEVAHVAEAVRKLAESLLSERAKLNQPASPLSPREVQDAHIRTFGAAEDGQ